MDLSSLLRDSPRHGPLTPLISEAPVPLRRLLPGQSFRTPPGLSFRTSHLRPAISQVLFLGVAALWLVPDRRVEQAVCEEQGNIP